MKKIMILYKDGTVKSKKEKKITKEDIKNSEFFLISVSDDNESYTIVKPSNYLLFTHAIIDYRLCAIFTSDDYYDIDIEELAPIHFETDSICDVIGLLNSVDRLTIPNELLNPQYLTDSAMSIGVSYFRLQLFDESVAIYDEYYQLKCLNEPIFDPYQVIKHFKKVYTNTILSSLFTNRESIYLYTSNGDVKWDISRKGFKYKLIGVVIPSSSNIIFLTRDQYKKMKKYDYITVNLFIYYDKISLIADISEEIVNGYTTKQRQYLLSKINDVYCDEEKYFGLHNHVVERFVNFIANSVFALNTLHLMFSELYGPYNTSEELQEYDFDAILTFWISHSRADSSRVECSMNRYSIINIDTIINNLD